MSLTKKDFIKVAEILRDTPNKDDIEIAFTSEEVEIMKGMREVLIKDFSEWFKSENPNFNEVKFREAVLK